MDSTFHPLGWTSASRQRTETEDKEVKCRHGETEGGWMRRIHAGAHCSLREHGTIVCFYSTLLSLLCWVMKPCVEFSFCSVGRWSAGRSPDYVLSLRLLTVGRYLLLFPLKVSLDITNKHLCINRISNPLLQNIQHDPTEVQFWNSSEHQLSSRLVLKCLFFYIWDSWTVDKHMSEHPLKTCFFFFIECDEMPSTVRPKQDKCSL